MGFKPKDPKVSAEMLASGPATSPPPPPTNGVLNTAAISALWRMAGQIEELNEKFKKRVDGELNSATYNEIQELLLLLGGMDLRIQKLIVALGGKKT